MEEANSNRLPNCACLQTSNIGGDFQLIANLENLGLKVYRHVNRRKPGADAELEDSDETYIIDCAKNIQLAKKDFAEELEKNVTSCPQCQNVIQRAQKSLQNVAIKKEIKTASVCCQCLSRRKLSCKCTDVVRQFHNWKDNFQLGNWINRINKVLRDLKNRDKLMKLTLTKSNSDLFEFIKSELKPVECPPLHDSPKSIDELLRKATRISMDSMYATPKSLYPKKHMSENIRSTRNISFDDRERQKELRDGKQDVAITNRGFEKSKYDVETLTEKEGKISKSGLYFYGTDDEKEYENEFKESKESTGTKGMIKQHEEVSRIKIVPFDDQKPDEKEWNRMHKKDARINEMLVDIQNSTQGFAERYNDKVSTAKYTDDDIEEEYDRNLKSPYESPEEHYSKWSIIGIRHAKKSTQKFTTPVTTSASTAGSKQTHYLKKSKQDSIITDLKKNEVRLEKGVAKKIEKSQNEKEQGYYSKSRGKAQNYNKQHALEHEISKKHNKYQNENGKDKSDVDYSKKHGKEQDNKELKTSKTSKFSYVSDDGKDNENELKGSKHSLDNYVKKLQHEKVSPIKMISSNERESKNEFKQLKQQKNVEEKNLQKDDTPTKENPFDGNKSGKEYQRSNTIPVDEDMNKVHNKDIRITETPVDNQDLKPELRGLHSDKVSITKYTDENIEKEHDRKIKSPNELQKEEYSKGSIIDFNNAKTSVPKFTTPVTASASTAGSKQINDVKSKKDSITIDLKHVEVQQENNFPKKSAKAQVDKEQDETEDNLSKTLHVEGQNKQKQDVQSDGFLKKHGKGQNKKEDDVFKIHDKNKIQKEQDKKEVDFTKSLEKNQNKNEKDEIADEYSKKQGNGQNEKEQNRKEDDYFKVHDKNQIKKEQDEREYDLSKKHDKNQIKIEQDEKEDNFSKKQGKDRNKNEQDKVEDEYSEKRTKEQNEEERIRKDSDFFKIHDKKQVKEEQIKREDDLSIKNLKLRNKNENHDEIDDAYTKQRGQKKHDEKEQDRKEDDFFEIHDKNQIKKDQDDKENDLVKQHMNDQNKKKQDKVHNDFIGQFEKEKDDKIEDGVTKNLRGDQNTKDEDKDKDTFSKVQKKSQHEKEKVGKQNDVNKYEKTQDTKEQNGIEDNASKKHSKGQNKKEQDEIEENFSKKYVKDQNIKGQVQKYEKSLNEKEQDETEYTLQKKHGKGENKKDQDQVEDIFSKIHNKSQHKKDQVEKENDFPKKYDKFKDTKESDEIEDNFSKKHEKGQNKKKQDEIEEDISKKIGKVSNKMEQQEKEVEFPKKHGKGQKKIEHGEIENHISNKYGIRQNKLEQNEKEDYVFKGHGKGQDKKESLEKDDDFPEKHVTKHNHEKTYTRVKSMKASSMNSIDYTQNKVQQQDGFGKKYGKNQNKKGQGEKESGLPEKHGKSQNKKELNETDDSLPKKPGKSMNKKDLEEKEENFLKNLRKDQNKKEYYESENDFHKKYKKGQDKKEQDEIEDDIPKNPGKGQNKNEQDEIEGDIPKKHGKGQNKKEKYDIEDDIPKKHGKSQYKKEQDEIEDDILKKHGKGQTKKERDEIEDNFPKKHGKGQNKIEQVVKDDTLTKNYGKNNNENLQADLKFKKIKSIDSITADKQTKGHQEDDILKKDIKEQKEKKLANNMQTISATALMKAIATKKNKDAEDTKEKKKIHKNSSDEKGDIINISKIPDTKNIKNTKNEDLGRKRDITIQQSTSDISTNLMLSLKQKTIPDVIVGTKIKKIRPKIPKLNGTTENKGSNGQTDLKGRRGQYAAKKVKRTDDKLEVGTRDERTKQTEDQGDSEKSTPAFPKFTFPYTPVESLNRSRISVPWDKIKIEDPEPVEAMTELRVTNFSSTIKPVDEDMTYIVEKVQKKRFEEISEEIEFESVESKKIPQLVERKYGIQKYVVGNKIKNMAKGNLKRLAEQREHLEEKAYEQAMKIANKEEIIPTFEVPKTKLDENINKDPLKGVTRYSLSDKNYIEKGWTQLPTEKVVRKMNVYRMHPAKPEQNWFERNKDKKVVHYDTGEKAAEIDENGRGRWYYKNGRLAMDYYNAEEMNTQRRIIIYSSGGSDDKGITHPRTVLAMFDYLGNGVVFDHKGKIRLKYNQSEGVILDKSLGPATTWKWHSLNDPPVLQQVMMDTQLGKKDPDILRMDEKAKEDTRNDNEEMLAIEYNNFVKENSKKHFHSFRPFQIKMKALKINENFSLKVLDQSAIHLIFREGSTNFKLNIGMILDHKEIIDTDMAEVGDVLNSVERLPPRSESLQNIQDSVALAQQLERIRLHRQQRHRSLLPISSADHLMRGASRPLKPMTTLSCHYYRKTCPNVYYDTRLI